MLSDHRADQEGKLFQALRRKNAAQTQSNRMILYDSHRWRTLCKLHGSILPKALTYAFIPAVISFALKYAEQQGYPVPKTISNNAAFSGFAWTVSFLLVFRTSQCYSRFWSCATNCSTMRSQIFDSCASLIAFSSISKSADAEVRAFRLKILQLFSAFHATAMASVAQTDSEFPVICADYMPEIRVEFLKDLPSERRTEVVYQWIQVLIMSEVDHGVLRQVPPPILNGAYQELGKAMCAYIEIMQVITLPFPFPYSQAALLMIILYMLVAPFVMVAWTHNAASAFLFTFFSAMCFWSLELIAAELENPFGSDVNDLPGLGFQDEINRGLLLLMDPMNAQPFELSGLGAGLVNSKEDYGKALSSDWSTIDEVRIDLVPESDSGFGSTLQLVAEQPEVAAPSSQQEPAIPGKLHAVLENAPLTLSNITSLHITSCTGMHGCALVAHPSSDGGQTRLEYPIGLAKEAPLSDHESTNHSQAQGTCTPDSKASSLWTCTPENVATVSASLSDLSGSKLVKM